MAPLPNIDLNISSAPERLPCAEDFVGMKMNTETRRLIVVAIQRHNREIMERRVDHHTPEHDALNLLLSRFDSETHGQFTKR